MRTMHVNRQKLIRTFNVAHALTTTPLLDLALLRTLAAVNQSGTLARAAERVGRTQSAVSLQMQRLEEAVGLPLFDRRGRSLVINEAGRSMVAYAERMLALNAEAVASARGHSVAGRVRLGISVDFEHTWLPRAMATFSKTHPRIVIELRVDRNSALERAIGKRELDVAMIIASSTGTGPAAKTSVPMAWIAARGFEWSGDRELAMLLLEQPCIFRSAAIRALDGAGIPWRIAVTSPSLGGIWATASAGIGVTVRSALNIPAGLVDVGERFGLPSLPKVAVNVIESDAPSTSTRASLRRVLDGLVEELLGNTRAA
jgi:DNA-binding transcriptional LysR family regulator